MDSVTISASAAPGFDYGLLPAETAEWTAATARRIKNRIRGSVITTGGELIEVRAKLGHGLFGKWLAAEFEMTERTAENYMAAARLCRSDPEKISNLPATAIYKLAAPSTPEPARQAILTRAGGGEVLTVREINNTISQAKSAAAEAARKVAIASLPRRRRERDKEAVRRSRMSAADKREAELRRQEAAASEAVSLLQQRLGDDFLRFAELWKAGNWRSGSLLQSKLEEARRLACAQAHAA